MTHTAVGKASENFNALEDNVKLYRLKNGSSGTDRLPTVCTHCPPIPPNDEVKVDKCYCYTRCAVFKGERVKYLQPPARPCTLGASGCLPVSAAGPMEDGEDTITGEAGSHSSPSSVRDIRGNLQCVCVCVCVRRVCVRASCACACVRVYVSARAPCYRSST